VLQALRDVPHVRLLRLATRAPAVLPMRVDDALAAALRRLAPLFVVTHFNHPKELTPEAREACERLVDHGVPVENQAVLLRGLNSSARALGDLFETLLAWRVRPYYLHQGDLAAGTGHLRTPLQAGVDLLAALRGRVSGLAIPHLAVDLPDGSGKITLAPDHAGRGGLERGEGGTWLRNLRGERVLYPEARSSNCDCPYDAVYYGTGAPPVTPGGEAGTR
jgi:lysine 2,3-aminomutase